MTTYLPRELAAEIARSRQSLPVVVVTGMRQVGKTTMLLRQRGLRTHRYASLDDFESLAEAHRDPAAFVRGRAPMTIDEAQRCPDLLVGIKTEVDRNRRPGMFLLSGSSNFALLKTVTESLAGRAIYHELEPMSRRELRKATANPPFVREFFETGRLPSGWQERSSTVTDDEVVAGGLPPAALSGPADRARWLRGFEQTYLERDLRQLSQVADLAAFQRLMRLAALRTGQILSVSELARDAGLPVPTGARYLRLLETSYVLRLVPPYTANPVARLVKSSKACLSDTGFACHLAGIRDARTLRRDPRRGAIFETYVVQNLRSVCAAHWPRAELAFWNVQGRHEVDLVVGEPEACLAVEIKAASGWRNEDLAGLNSFLRHTPQCRVGILAYNGTKPEQIHSRLWAVPLGLLLS